MLLGSLVSRNNYFEIQISLYYSCGDGVGVEPNGQIRKIKETRCDYVRPDMGNRPLNCIKLAETGVINWGEDTVGSS